MARKVVGNHALLMLCDARLDIERLVSIDLDPACAAVAETMNQSQVKAGLFEAVTADILFNTSCEHLIRIPVDSFGPRGSTGSP